MFFLDILSTHLQILTWFMWSSRLRQSGLLHRIDQWQWRNYKGRVDKIGRHLNITKH